MPTLGGKGGRGGKGKRKGKRGEEGGETINVDAYILVYFVRSPFVS